METKRNGITDAVDELAGRIEVKTVGDFISLVERMRTLQKLFFQNNGNRFYLMEAQKLEAQVDACIQGRREREKQTEQKGV